MRSISWNEGSEMARHIELNIATGVPIYFFYAWLVWLRGSIEKINGLIYQYMPEGTEAIKYSSKTLEEIRRGRCLVQSNPSI